MNTTGKRAALLANALLAMVLMLGAGQAAAVEYWLCAKAGSVTMPGAVSVPIWGYAQDDDSNLANGCPGAPALPGPALAVPAGDTVLTVHLRNELPEPTSIVIPGQIGTAMTPVWDSGPPGPRTSLTQRVRSFTHEAATTGVAATYTWNNVKPGTYLYHSGTLPQVQVQMGLYGAVVKNAVDAVVSPATPAEAYSGVPYETQVTLLFSEMDPAQHAAIASGTFGTGSAPSTPCPDSGGASLPMTSTLCYKPKYFLINGKPFQSGDAALATLQAGQRTLLRFLNAGVQSYAPLLQGMHMKMIAEDGNRYVYRVGTGAPQPRDQYQYSTLLPALKTVDAVITPTQSGRYPIYDRRLNLVNATSHNGGMFAFFDAVGADLAITKTDGVTSVAQGAPLVYTIRVTNNGLETVTGATVADTMPAVLTGVTWTCSATAGSSCAAASGSGNIGHTVNLAAGGIATFSVSATVAVDAPVGAGALVNTATVTAPAGVADPPDNNSATDTDEITPAEQAQSNLGITKTNLVNGVVAGGPVTYTIVVTNAGAPVTGALVTDTLPAALTGVTWSCTASGAGSSCGLPNSGNAGNINRLVNLASSGSATFIVNGTVAASATGTLANTANVAPPAGVSDPVPANNSATDTDAISRPADLAITKTNGVTNVVADGSVTYTIVASNAGPTAVTAARVTDTMPAALAGVRWRCAASAGSACGATRGTSNINTTVNLAVNGSATFTVTARVRSNATGLLTNTATVAAPAGISDPNAANNSQTDTDSIGVPTANLGITKTDGVTSVAPGGGLTYTIVTSNAGPTAVAGASVTDTMPAALTGVSWSCVASAGSACGAASGTGNIGTTVNLLVSGTATFTVAGTVSAAATGNLINTATVAVPAGVTDPTPANNSATDTDAITPPSGTQANLGISKTDGLTSVFAGEAVSYTIVVSNAGPAAVTGASVTDTLPAALTGATWSCVASAGSSCGTPATGNVGNISRAVNLLNGGSATFTVNATVAAGSTGSVVNTATVAAPAGVTDPTPANNSASDTDTITAIPTPTFRDNFNRVNADNLGANWSQTGTGTDIDLRVNNNQAFANQVEDGGQAIWNVAIFGSTQAAGYTYASAIGTRNNSALILKATGGATIAAPQNFVRVLYLQSVTPAVGQVLVQTTTNGNAATPTWTTHGTLNNANSSITQGNRLNAQVDNTGRVRVWKSDGTGSVYIGKAVLPANALWTTGGGRIGMKFASPPPNGTRVDDFRGN